MFKWMRSQQIPCLCDVSQGVQGPDIRMKSRSLLCLKSQLACQSEWVTESFDFEEMHVNTGGGVLLPVDVGVYTDLDSPTQLQPPTQLHQKDF